MWRFVAAIEFLDENEVSRRLATPALIEAMEFALMEFSAGRVVQPVRQFVEVEAHHGYFGLMPAVADAMGVKLVTFYPENDALGLHTHYALVVVFDPATGVPRAVLDGRIITERRTAAVSAVATRLLARPDASTLAVLGTGLQARAHVDAIRAVRPIDRIRIWGRNNARAHALAQEVGGEVTTAEAAVRGASIVVTATPAMEPILHGEWLEPGAHVNAVGWNGNDARELDDKAMANLVFVESRAGSADQAGNVRGSGAAITAEIGEALASPNPEWQAVTTVFDSVGMAIEDVVAAQLVLDSPPATSS